MDVVAINLSLIVATIISLFTAFLIPFLYFGWTLQTEIKVLIPFVISILVLAVLWKSSIVLGNQISDVLASIFKKHT
jgi:hypothetical protein